jgi:Uma2 family endonuclease
MTATITLPEPPATVAATSSQPWQRKRWTIAEFDRLLQQGFFREGGPEFLWDGEIYSKMSENQPHVNATMNLIRVFLAWFADANWTVNLEKPIELREGYKPQPDLTVMRGPRSTYRRRAAVSADVVLLVEVSDTTYPDDFRTYLRGYSAAGIPVYWIVNILAQRVEVYTEPWSKDDGTSGYTTRHDFGLGDSIPIEGVEPVAVADILRDSLEPTPEAGA